MNLIKRLSFREAYVCLIIVTWVGIIVFHNRIKERPKPQRNIKTKERKNESKMEKFYKHFAPEPNDKFTNHHQYTFTLSSALCEKNTYHAIIVIHSKPSNYYRRKFIRTTFGSVKQYQGKLLTVVFMLGAVNDKRLQDHLKQESQLFGDIVQGNLIDSYKNLTMKHIMAMHWFNINCKADFVVKLDDNTFVNPFRLVEYLGSVPENELSVLYCKVVLINQPSRDPDSESYIPISQFPFKTFPPYCLGFAYITTPRVWKALYATSRTVSPIYMDDVYVTGILASLSDIFRIDISNILYDCSEHLKTHDVDRFRNNVAVLDRFDNCSDKYFHHWRGLSKQQL